MANQDGDGGKPQAPAEVVNSWSDLITGTTQTVESPSGALGMPSLPPGRRLGRYEVVRVLGSGGMGAVYEARDYQLDRLVALKLLSVPAKDEESRDRLCSRMLREAQALAQLSHANVVAVYDVGTTEGRVFIAMEYIAGLTLDAWCAQPGRSREEILAAYVAAGDGLVAAHRAGLVHRDFKPQNVIVGDDGRVRVIDFGLARIHEDEGLAPATAETTSSSGSRTSPDSTESVDSRTGSSLLNSNLTEVGAVLGTPRYMSPEQRRGVVADSSSDQYSFCTALYEALVGTLPFESQARTATAGVSLEPKWRTPAKGRTLPRWLERALRRGLASRPQDRWPTLEALLRELRRDRTLPFKYAAVGLGVLIALGAVGFAQTRERPVERCLRSAPTATIWTPAVSKALRADFLAVDAAYGGETFTRVDRRMARLQQEWRRAHEAACRATHTEFTQSQAALDERMACLRRRQTRTKLLLNHWQDIDRDGLDHALPALETVGDPRGCADDLGAQTAAPTGIVEKELLQIEKTLDEAVASNASGDYRKAASLLDPLFDRVFRTDSLSLQARVGLERSLVLTSLNDFDQAIDANLRAVESAIQADLPVLELKGLNQLAFGYMVAGRLPEAEAVARTVRYRLARETALAEEEVRILRLIGRMHLDAGRLPQAEAAYLAALSLARSRLTPRHVADVQGYLGALRRNQGRSREALELAQSAYATYERDFGPAHPRTIVLLTYLAQAQRAVGEHDESIRNLQVVLASDVARFGTEHRDLVEDYTNLGQATHGKGELTASLGYYEKAYDICLKLLGEDDVDALDALRSLAVAQSLVGQRELAKQNLTSAIEKLRRDKSMAAYLFFTLADLADIASEDGELNAAHKYALEAHELALQMFQETHPATVRIRNSLSSIARLAGDNTEAVEWGEKATHALQQLAETDTALLAATRLTLARALASGPKKDITRARALAQASSQMLGDSKLYWDVVLRKQAMEFTRSLPATE